MKHIRRFNESKLYVSINNRQFLNTEYTEFDNRDVNEIEDFSNNHGFKIEKTSVWNSIRNRQDVTHIILSNSNVILKINKGDDGYFFIRIFNLRYKAPSHQMKYGSDIAKCDGVEGLIEYISDSIKEYPKLFESANLYNKISVDEFTDTFVMQEISDSEINRIKKFASQNNMHVDDDLPSYIVIKDSSIVKGIDEYFFVVKYDLCTGVIEYVVKCDSLEGLFDYFKNIKDISESILNESILYTRINYKDYIDSDLLKFTDKDIKEIKKITDENGLFFTQYSPDLIITSNDRKEDGFIHITKGLDEYFFVVDGGPDSSFEYVMKCDSYEGVSDCLKKIYGL